MTTEFQRRAVEVGKRYERQIEEWARTKMGWTIIRERSRYHESGIEIDILAQDRDGKRIAIECKGGEADRPGLLRGDNLWKALGCALALKNWNDVQPPEEQLRYLVVCSAQPPDDARLAGTIAVAEARGQIGVITVPQEPAAVVSLEIVESEEA